MFINSRIIILILLAASMLGRMVLYHPHPPLWDASAYVLMGKYLFTHGSVGLVEPFRPLVWPMCLGFLYWVGMDPILVGTMVQIVMSLACIALIYRIGKKVYDGSTGLIAAILLSLSPSFMFWGNALYSEIPAVFFSLFAFDLFLGEWYFLAGICASLTFFTKFTQLTLVIILCAGAFACARFRKDSRPIVYFVVGAIGGLVPFLWIQNRLYGDMLYPFQEGGTIYGQVQAHWLEGMVVTLTKIWVVDPILVLVPVGLMGLARSNFKNGMIAAAAILSLIWIGKIPTSVIRYALLALPFLYLLSAYGFVKILRWSKIYNVQVAVWIIFACLCCVQIWKISSIQFPSEALNRFQRYIADHQRESFGKKIWISSPTTLALSNLKAAESMYYPVFDVAKARYLLSRVDDVDLVLVDTNDIPCAPLNDPMCNEARQFLIHSLVQHLTTIDNISYPDGHIRAIFMK